MNVKSVLYLFNLRIFILTWFVVNKNTQTNVIHQPKLMQQSTHQCAIASATKLNHLKQPQIPVSYTHLTLPTSDLV